jgi:hypothetical protein
MKNKLRLFVCYLLICAIVPINLTFARTSIDLAGDGIHIDDIVYYLTHTGSLSNSDLRNLLDQIAPIISTPTPTPTPTPIPTETQPRITNVIMVSNNADPTKAMIGDTLTLTFTTDELVTKLSNFKINGSNPDTFTNVGNVYTATHLVDAGDIVGATATYQINVKNAAGIYSQTVEQPVGGSSVSITPIPIPSWITTGGTVTASGENGPGEGKEKAFDGTTSTKWYNPSSTGWIQLQLTAAHIVTQYLVASANDSPGRDPKDWTLKGSNDGTNWTILDTRAGQTFAGRFQTNTYTFSNSTSYLYYRLDVSANSGDSALQLSEIGLFGTPAPVVIDISNNATNGTSFGSTANEVKRFQTFTANNNPNLTSVDVKIHKRIDGAQTDVTVQLFATSGGIPSGSPLASTTISSSLVGTSYSEIKVLLTYNGMINGTKYAIVLGQTTNDDGNNYEWLSGQSGITGQNFGKFDGASTWTDESNIGNAWLKVYVY